MTPADVRRRVELSRRAQPSWSTLPFPDRVEALRRAAKAMLADRARIIRLAKDEIGKLEVDGLFTEALGPLDNLNGWVGVIEPYVAPETVRLNPLAFPRKEARTSLVPRGVIGVIAPWNFPAAGLYRSVYPALLLGNGVVVKPSELTPKSSAWFVDHLASELPADLISVVQGDGQVGEHLIDSGIDACNFTGSVETGRKVAVRCAERGVLANVELGGSDVAIVLGDAALPRTTAGLTHWALQNAGQACGAVEAVFVERQVADELVERLTKAFTALRTGASESLDVDVAPLASDDQVERVDAQVRAAVDAGAKLLCGGTPGPGRTYPPTLLDGCTFEMDVIRKETFGPVLAVVRVGSAHEAIDLVNRLPFGLTASVWTSDVARGARLADRLNVGVVTINNHALTGAIPELPWAGTRESGPGIANSRWALTTFARPKAVLIDRSSGPEPFWPPFGADLAELGSRLADAQLQRVARAWKVPFLLRRRSRRIRKFFGW